MPGIFFIGTLRSLRNGYNWITGNNVDQTKLLDQGETGADIARAGIGARVTKSSGDVIKPPILVHTSSGTFAAAPVTNNTLCVKRG